MNSVVSIENLTTLTVDEKRALLARLLQSARSQLQLSVTQERLWQLDQLQPGNPIYNFQSAIELQGELDLPRLQAALMQLVARQEVLRTRYGIDKGQAKLHIATDLAPPLLDEDWTACSEGEQSQRLAARAKLDAQTGFPLDQLPLFRLSVLKLAAQRHVLLLTMHHIISDLLSLEIFFQELGQLYSATTPEPLTVSYQDFARYQRKLDFSQSPAAEYWRTTLAEAPLLEWLSDFPRPARPAHKAATTFFTLNSETLARVEVLARSERITPFMVLLSAFYVLVHGASGAEDIIVGSPTAGRTRSEYEALIGMFSYPMALRTRLDGNPSFSELLRRVRSTVLGAAEHVDLPFAQVMDLAQQAGAARGQLVRPMFSYISRMKAIDFAGLSSKRVATDRGMNDFDLFLTVCQEAGQWFGVFEYNTELFSAATARAWATAYTELIELAVQEPATPVATLARRVPAQQPYRIALAATFTADGLDDVVRHWSRELRYPLHVDFAPYNQVFQQLLDPNSLFHSGPQQANVLLLRPEDWVRYQDDPAQRQIALQQATGEVVHTLRTQAGSWRVPVLVYICPASPDSAGQEEIGAAEELLVQELTGLPGIEVVRAQAAMADYPVAAIHDAQADSIGHIPFTQDWFTAFGSTLVRRLSRHFRQPYKVVALDCDNTLWRGIAGEDGVGGVRIDGAYRALQQFMLQLADSGMLLCLVSKNQEADVRAVFEQHPDMLLRWEHVVAQRVNWEPKSRNLHALAAELQLGLDSFIFIDDNPVECAEVRDACPEVLTLCLPSVADDIPDFLRHVWAFDRARASEEDRQRVRSYQQNRQRTELQQQYGSFDDFLRNLNLVVDISAPSAEQIPRLAQLSQRTNQFNSSGLRLDEAGLARELGQGLQALAVQVKDRFGDYGLVGAAFYKTQGSTQRIEGFMLSCRVLGRGVEHRMLQALAELAAHADTLELVYRELPRNQPMRTFLASLPGAFVDMADGERVYRLSAAQALQLRFDPAQALAGESAEASSTGSTPVSSNTSAYGAVAERQRALAAIAEDLRSVEAIRARMDSQGRKKRSASTQAPPQSETEQLIADAWRQVLNIDQVGRDDNFFEVGGSSLLLVQVNGLLIEKFGRDIAITDLFQFPTIAALAQHLGVGTSKAGLNVQQSQERGQQARQNMQKRLQQWSTLRRS